MIEEDKRAKSQNERAWTYSNAVMKEASDGKYLEGGRVFLVRRLLLLTYSMGGAQWMRQLC